MARRLSPLLALALTCSTLAAGAAVHPLTRKNFTNTVALNPIVLVEFFAPWCGHCKKFAPIYERASSALNDMGILVTTVDCVAEQDLYWEAEVTSFPTIKMYVYNEVVTYNGPRELEAIIAFGRKFKTNRLLDFSAIRDWSEFQEAKLTAVSPVIIGFGDEVEKAELNLVCIIFDRIPCAFSSNRMLAERLNVPYPSYSMIKQFPGEESAVVASVATETSGVITPLLDFMRREAFPAVIEFNGDTSDFLFSPDRAGFQNHIIFLVDLSDENDINTLEMARKLAPDFYGKCLFAYIDLSLKSRYITNLLLDLNVDKKYPPLALSIRSQKDIMRFYRLEQDSGSIDNVSKLDKFRDWIISSLRGELEPFKVVSDGSDESAPPGTENGQEIASEKSEL